MCNQTGADEWLPTDHRPMFCFFAQKVYLCQSKGKQGLCVFSGLQVCFQVTFQISKPSTQWQISRSQWVKISHAVLFPLSSQVVSPSAYPTTSAYVHHLCHGQQVKQYQVKYVLTSVDPAYLESQCLANLKKSCSTGLVCALHSGIPLIKSRK